MSKKIASMKPGNLRFPDPLQGGQHCISLDRDERASKVTRRTALRSTFIVLFGEPTATSLLDFAANGTQAEPINLNETFLVQPNDIQFKPWQGLPPSSGEIDRRAEASSLMVTLLVFVRLLNFCGFRSVL